VTSQRIIAGDCIEGMRTLPDASVHCCVTSPPYWGLRDYGHDGQIGLESTPDAYVARMVEVFREVRRVLREDGTCWVNLGDSYAGGGGFCPTSPSNLAGAKQTTQGSKPGGIKPQGTIKAKDLVGIPWRVAFALQADGWWLRQDIIWHKTNPMPESVRDRCTKAHEYVFLLTKSERYYYDADAVSEAVACVRGPGNKKPLKGVIEDPKKHATRAGLHKAAERWREEGPPESRNRRSVWTITTKPYSGAHFAVMPSDLVEPCIKAGCPEQCCSVCGSPWVRVVERKRVMRHELPVGDPNYRPGRYTSKAGGADEYSNGGGQAFSFSSTKGWAPSCECQRMMCDAVMMGDHGVAVSTIPGTVLDPFAGSGTTLAVAAELGRSGIGCELNPEYIALAERRIKDARSSVALFEGVPA
jgi:DNA modification methylase